VDPSRTEAVKNFPPPQYVKWIARFIGMVNYFHKLIPHFAESAVHLNLLRKEGEKFAWGTEQQSAFEDFKLAIIKPPIL
jgi:cleavage and polyadenylation specificity factor subunit 1